jgi:hypothetical protein
MIMEEEVDGPSRGKKYDELYNKVNANRKQSPPTFN